MQHCRNKRVTRTIALASLVLCNCLIGCHYGRVKAKGPVGGASRYTIVDLGPLRPTGINTSGQIVGNVNTAATPHPAFWESGVMTLLQSLNGLNDEAHAINDLGQIVGHTGGTGTTSTDHTVIWANSKAAPVALPLPAGTTENASDALGINNNGDVVGFGVDATHQGFFNLGINGIVWSHGTPAGVILPGLTDAIGTAILSVNTSGQAVGVSAFPNQVAKQVLFTISPPGTVQDLGIDLTAASTSHTDTAELPSYINATGSIVGTLKGTNGQAIAYLRQPTGQVTQITILSSSAPNTGIGLTETEATGINAGGTVIVNINPDNQGATPTCATFAPVTGLRDLNALVPSGSGWQLQSASGISDKGQIVGTGQFQGSTHGFLLNPISAGM